jgi:CRP-like cAMP-binding protein
MSSTRLSRLAPFIGLAPDTLRGLAAAASWEHLPAGRIVAEETSFLDDFSVIENGLLSVERAGVKLALLKRGDCFGRRVYCPDNWSLADMRAASPLSLLHFQSLDLERFAAEDSQLMYRLSRLAGVAP